MESSENNSGWNLLLCLASLILVAAAIFLHPVGTSDLFWQIKTGELIWLEGFHPKVDVFSFTASGTAWIDPGWFSEFLFYYGDRSFGMMGLSFLSLFIGIAICLCLFVGLRRFSRSDFRAFLLMLFVMLIGAPRFSLLRPELFGFLFFSVFVALLSTHESDKVGKLWILVPLQILWTNMHASAIVGIALILIFSITRRKLLMLAASCLISMLINPYTYRAITYPFEHMGQSYSLSITSDWVSSSLFLPSIDIAAWGCVILLVISALMMIKNRKFPLSNVIVSLIFFVFGMRMSRFMPLAAISISFLLARAWGVSRVLDGPRERRGALAVLLAAAVLLLSLFVGIPYGFRMVGEKPSVVYGERVGLGLNARAFPVAAADFIEKLGPRYNMFNDMAYGGYLIYRLWPTHKVFIDTRTPLYGDEFIREYSNALFDALAFENLVIKYEIGYIIYDAREIRAPGGPLKFLLNDPRWAPAFQSENAIAFIPSPSKISELP